MRDVVLDDVIFVDEGPLALGAVVVDVVVEGLAQEIEAVEVVETFDVCGETAAVFGVDLNLVMSKTGFGGFADWDGYASIFNIVRI